MKKTHFITTLLISALVLASCNGNAGTAPDTSDGNGDVATYKAGDSALANIIINGKTYDKTGEVYVTGPDGATVIGADPSFIASAADDKCKGVFRKGKNVTLNPYIMSKYPVTQELYTAVMTGNADEVIAEPFECKQTGDYPLVTGEVQKYRAAEGMSWYDAVYFCNALTEKTMTAADKVYTIKNITVDPTKGYISSATVTIDKTKKGYRLPTEAEWEFAARGGAPDKAVWNYLFSGAASGKVSTEEGAENATDDSHKNTGLDIVGWYWFNRKDGTTGDETPYQGNEGYGTRQVGLKAANTLGIFDMSGSIWEWCDDCYNDERNYIRGGGWGSWANQCTVCFRYTAITGKGGCDVGFRVVRSAQ